MLSAHPHYAPWPVPTLAAISCLLSFAKLSRGRTSVPSHLSSPSLQGKHCTPRSQAGPLGSFSR